MKKETILARLESLYPEHKVFALSGLDDKLREAMASSYWQLGYSSVEEFLHANGYEIISGEAVRELRSFVVYPPGTEPLAVASKVRSILNRLMEYYPDRKIIGAIQNEHKSLSSDISAMYQWLGYDSMGSMLEAYGYEYVVSTGRNETDFDAVIDFLIQKYETEPKPKTIGLLMHDNPDLRGTLKTLQNRAQELFGMTLKQYFADLGILAERGESSSAAPAGEKAPVGGKMQEAARTALRQLYAENAQGDYGTAGELEAAIEALTVKQKKTGQIYLGGVVHCPERLKIPFGVQSISDGAFSGCAALREVILPETLQEIGKEAFAGCASLERITLPSGLTEIGKRAFADCAALRDVDLSRCMAKIAKDAFDEGAVSAMPGEGDEACDFEFTFDRQHQMTITGYHGAGGAVQIPAEINGFPVVSIAREAFSGQTGITEVDMADTIVSLGAQAFAGCSSLRRAHLSEKIERIYTNAFNGCTALQEINIPDAVTELKNNTFSESPLRVLHIGSGLPSLNINALQHGTYDAFGNRHSRGIVRQVTVSPASTRLRAEGTMVLSADGTMLFAALGGESAYRIPDGVTGIAANAFSGLTKLADVTLPDSLVTIGERAFSETALRSVSFGPALRTIGDGAFSYCQKLSAVLFQNGVESIGENAFNGCPIVSLSLPASLRELGENSFSFLSPYGWDNTLRNLEIDPANPWIHAQDSGFYQIVDGEMTLRTVVDRGRAAFNVAPGTVRIAPGACRYSSELRQLTLPDSLQEIGEEAFRGCSELGDVVFPEGLKVIGDRAFEGTEIQSAALPAGLESLGRGALPASQIQIDNSNSRFFAEDHMLYERLPEGGTAARAFLGETDRFLLRRDTVCISAYAFQNAALQELYVPRSVSTIEEHAFENSLMLRRLYIEQPNEERWAAIYLPQMSTSGFLFFEDTSRRDQLMDCIRFGQSGTLFDFVKYDSLFAAITVDTDRILIAADRLSSGVELMPAYRQAYESYLRENPELALRCIISDGDVSGCHLLCNLGVVTAQNVDEALSIASERGDAAITSLLLTYQKNQKLDADPMAEFTLDW